MSFKAASQHQLKRPRRNFSFWFWLLPAIVLMAVFLIYPVVDTARVSFLNANSSQFVGWENYAYIFTNSASTSAILNNLLWIVVFTLFTVGLGLVLAVLTAHVRFEPAAKAAIFIPMAVSFVAAAVIWKFVYAYSPEGFVQIGLLNAVGAGVGLPPEAWLVQQQLPYSTILAPTPFHTNNFAIIAAGVWMWTGFAMVILSAGLKSIPREVLEAARVDGASEFQIFLRVTTPLLIPIITVVATTLVIQALKIFDIVWVISAGNFGTDVMSTRIYKEMFNYQNFGHAAAMAMVLLLLILPAMLINIRRFRSQER